MVSQDHIARRVQLYKDVVGAFTLAKSEVNNTVNTELLNLVELFCPQVLPEFHGEATGKVFFVFNVIGSVNPDSRLDEQVFLAISSRQLEQVETT